MEAITWIVIILAISIGFFVQAVAGFAAALTSLPILLLVLELPDAVALLSFLFVISSILLVMDSWREARWRIVIQLAIGILIGLLIGVWLLVNSPSSVLKQLLGVFILLYVGYTYISHKHIKAFDRLAVMFGVIGGIFSGLFATGGPPNVIFVNNALKKVGEIRATIIAALAVGSFIRIPLLWRNNVLTMETFSLFIGVLPFFLLAIFLGEKIAHKIPEKLFKNVLMVLLTIAGIGLLIP